MIRADGTMTRAAVTMTRAAVTLDPHGLFSLPPNRGDR
jgi:hypothetical protein